MKKVLIILLLSLFTFTASCATIFNTKKIDEEYLIEGINDNVVELNHNYLIGDLFLILSVVFIPLSLYEILFNNSVFYEYKDKEVYDEWLKKQQDKFKAP